MSRFWQKSTKKTIGPRGEIAKLIQMIEQIASEYSEDSIPSGGG